MFSRSFLLVCICVLAVWMVDSQRLRGSGRGTPIVVKRNGTASFDFPIPRFSSGVFMVGAPNNQMILALDSHGISNMSHAYINRYTYTGDLSEPRMKFNLSNMQHEDEGFYKCIFLPNALTPYQIRRCGQRVTVRQR